MATYGEMGIQRERIRSQQALSAGWEHPDQPDQPDQQDLRYKLYLHQHWEATNDIQLF